MRVRKVGSGRVVKKEKEDLGFCVVEEDGLSVYKDENNLLSEYYGYRY